MISAERQPDGFNPFPDFPVTRLQEDPSGLRKQTIPTSQIEQISDRVNDWARQWKKTPVPDSKRNPAIISIRGDYGSGKTHLLVYSISELAQTLQGRPYLLLRAAALETDPLSWYTETLSSQVAAAGLPDMMLLAYARAGKTIATATRLTEGGEKLLDENPSSILKLVRDNLLSRTAVDDKLQEILTTAGVAGPEVRKALGALVWGETQTAAMNWLAPKSAAPGTVALPALLPAIADPENVSSVLQGIAALHSLLDKPFLFVVDELEHLVQFDLAHNSRIAVTWLKRLVEDLAAQGALIVLSGHWDAWIGHADLLDRLPGLSPILLPVLRPNDVISICDVWVRPAAITPEQAASIIEVTEGNRRKVLSLCRSLFQKSGQFQSPLTPDEIRQTAEDISQKLSPEGAALAVLGILERLGLQTERPGRVQGIEFDLLGSRGNQPKVVVEIKHSVTQQHQLRQAQDFLERAKRLPEVVGCFLFDGAVNPEILPLFATHGLQRFIYDLNRRDVVARIRADLVPLLSAGPVITGEQKAQQLTEESAKLTEKIVAAEQAQDTHEANRLKQQRELVEQQLEKLTEIYAKATSSLQQQLLDFEAKRSAESADFQKQVANALGKIADERKQAVITPQLQPEEYPARALFFQFTGELPRYVRYRFAVSPGVMLTGAFAFLCLVALTLDMGKLFFPTSSTSYYLFRAFMIVVPIALALTSGLMVFRRFSLFDQRENYHHRLLHEIFVRRGTEADLSRVDNIIRSSFEENDFRNARRQAEEELAREYPAVYRYLVRDSSSTVADSSDNSPAQAGPSYYGSAQSIDSPASSPPSSSPTSSSSSE